MSDLQSCLDQALKKVDIQKMAASETVSVPDYDIDEEVRQLIVATRNRLGISQKQLSERTGISQANISKIENGINHPGAATLKRIAGGMGKRLIIDFADLEAEE